MTSPPPPPPSSTPTGIPAIQSENSIPKTCPMGIAGEIRAGTLNSGEETVPLNTPLEDIPKDPHRLAYIAHFILGAGFLLPWNAFITAVDYFDDLYPKESIDKVFAIVYMLVCLVFLLLIIAIAGRSNAKIRINLGLSVFIASLLVVPLLDAFYLKGRSGLYFGYYVTVAAVALSGVADALVQGSLIGAAGELPAEYMQAVVAGTAASGVLVSFMRIITKAIFSQNEQGLRKSAFLYFSVSIVFQFICLVCYNMLDKIPIVHYYKQLKVQAVHQSDDVEKSKQGSLLKQSWASNLWVVMRRIKWYGLGIFLIYMVTLSIFPGYITEDVHSQIFKDWYSIFLIACYNVFDLVGKSLTSVYMLENSRIAIIATFSRLLFYPLFFLCLHGPSFFRTEIPVALLTCLLGLTNGYLTSVLMILAPKSVALEHAEAAGILIVLFLIVGLAVGSVVAWFWVI